MVQKILAREDQGEQKAEHGHRRNALLLIAVASFQQAADSLIMKELVNLVFTGNNVWYSLAHSVTSCIIGFCWGTKPLYHTLLRYTTNNYNMLQLFRSYES